MVGGDRVDRAVGQPGSDGRDVVGGPQRRVDLVQRVVRGQPFVGETEVVRRRLGRDRQSVGLGLTHELDAPGGRQVQEVHRHAGEPHQFDVAVQHQLLGDRRPSRQAQAAAAVALVHHCARREALDLAVLRQRDAEPVGILERSTHEERVLHPVAVVGEQLHTGTGELGERGEGLPRPADGDRSGRQHLAQPGAFALTAHEVDHLDAVLRRIGVGHRDDSREPSECSGAAAGLDRLGLLPTRLTQMHVEVDEPGTDHEAGGIDHPIVVTRWRARLPTSEIEPSMILMSPVRSPVASMIRAPVISRLIRGFLPSLRPGW